MDSLDRLSALQRNLIIAALPTLGMLIYMMSGWDYTKAGLAAVEGASTSGLLIVPIALVVAGFVIAFLTANSQADRDNTRLRQALETCKANVMVADNDFNIKYMNKSVVQMMKDNETKLRDALPNFNASNLVGANVDVFHQNPNH